MMNIFPIRLRDVNSECFKIFEFLMEIIFFGFLMIMLKN